MCRVIGILLILLPVQYASAWPESSRQLELVERDGSASYHRLLLVGSYAYCLDSRRGIDIYDLYTYPEFVRVRQFPLELDLPDDRAVSMALRGEYLYVSLTYKGFFVYDIREPREPKKVFHFDPVWAVGEICLTGQHAYVLNSLYGLYIFDLANPAQPRLAGNCNLNSQPAYAPLRTAGHLLYINKLNKVEIWDIAVPLSPRKLSEYPVTSPVNHLEPYGQYLLVSGYNSGFIILDCSKPESPQLAGSWTPAMSLTRFLVKGSNVYITCEQPGGIIFLTRLDISDVQHPVQSGVLPIVGLTDYQSDGENDYLLAGTLKQVNLNWKNPVTVERFEPPAGLSAQPRIANSTGDLQYGAGLLICRTDSAIQIMETGDEGLPRMAGRITPGYGSISLSGRKLISIDLFNNKMRIFDLSDPGRPLLLRTCNLPLTARIQALDWPIAYVGDEDRLLWADVSNPQVAPVWRRVAWPGSEGEEIRGVFAGSCLCCVNIPGYDKPKKLVILDMSNPANPVPVLEVPGYIAGQIDFSGRQLHITNGDQRGFLADCTKPEEAKYRNIILDSSFRYLCPITGHLVIFKEAEPTTSGRDLQFRYYGNSDPLKPVKIGEEKIPGLKHASAVTWDAEHVYIFGYDHQYQYHFWRITLSGPASPCILKKEQDSLGWSIFAGQGRWLFSACQDNTISAYDTWHSRHRVRTSVFPASYPMDLICRGSRLFFLTSGQGGCLEVLDVSNPDEIQLLGILPATSHSVNNLSVDPSGQWCANPAGYESLSIIDCRDPEQPRPAGTIPFGRTGCFAGNLFVTAAPFSVWDLADPQNPAELAHTPWEGNLVAAGERYAYLAGGSNNELKVLDLRDPRAPEAVQTIIMPSLAGNYLTSASLAPPFLSITDSNRFLIYDVSDPRNPVLAAQAAGFPSIRCLHFDGYHFYLGNTNGDTYIFRLFAIPGDLDEDRQFTCLDLQILAQRLDGKLAAGQFPFTARSDAADLNGDGQVNGQDLGLMKEKLAENEEE